MGGTSSRITSIHRGRRQCPFKAGMFEYLESRCSCRNLALASASEAGRAPPLLKEKVEKKRILRCVSPKPNREHALLAFVLAIKSKCNEPPEGDKGSRTGLVSRARIPLTLNPRKKGFTRVPPKLADMASRPAGHASRRRTHWRNKQGADARNKTHKKRKAPKT